MGVDGRAKRANRAPRTAPLEFNLPADAPAVKLEKQLPSEKRRGEETRRNQFVEGWRAERGRAEVKGEWEKTDGQSTLSLGSY